jgi:hypothetical protein
MTSRQWTIEIYALAKLLHKALASSKRPKDCSNFNISSRHEFSCTIPPPAAAAGLGLSRFRMFFAFKVTNEDDMHCQPAT